MTAVAKILGVSASKVKYLWNGRYNKNGVMVATPKLNYRVTPEGKRFSTMADIKAFMKSNYKTTLTL